MAMSSLGPVSSASNQNAPPCSRNQRRYAESEPSVVHALRCRRALICSDHDTEQGGWHTGVRFEGQWLAHISTEIVLRPTHWLPAPADPPGFDQ
jgi:hypothetical protein